MGTPPLDSALALARVVAAADLAEEGRIAITSTEGMSENEFLALVRKSAPHA